MIVVEGGTHQGKSLLRSAVIDLVVGLADLVLVRIIDGATRDMNRYGEKDVK